MTSAFCVGRGKEQLRPTSLLHASHVSNSSPFHAEESQPTYASLLQLLFHTLLSFSTPIILLTVSQSRKSFFSSSQFYFILTTLDKITCSADFQLHSCSLDVIIMSYPQSRKSKYSSQIYKAGMREVFYIKKLKDSLSSIYHFPPIACLSYSHINFHYLLPETFS